jgi:hypothetical protein
MNRANLAFVVSQATGRQDDPFGAAVAASVEVGMIIPSILRTRLQTAGFTVVEDKAALAEYGIASTAVLSRVVVRDSVGDIVAMGAADGSDEALLAATLGWFREHPLPDTEVPPGIAVAPGSLTN